MAAVIVVQVDDHEVLAEAVGILEQAGLIVEEAYIELEAAPYDLADFPLVGQRLAVLNAVPGYWVTAAQLVTMSGLAAGTVIGRLSELHRYHALIERRPGSSPAEYRRPG